MNMMNYTVSIGVPVHNEQKSLEPFIKSLLAQDDFEFFEVVFILSGCTDASADIITRYRQHDKRVILEHQAQREGKASAVDLFLKRAKGDILVLASCDIVLEKHCMANLVSVFNDPATGMSGAHPVPLKNSRGAAYFFNALLWQLHHELAVISPKLGEAVAFRNIIGPMPHDTVADEAYIEARIHQEGYRLVYRPDAVVYNRCPVQVTDFFIQRLRIFLGHLDIKRKYGYTAASANMFLVARCCLNYLCRHPYMVIPFLALSVIEFTARTAASVRYIFKETKTPHVWPVYVK